MKEKIHPKYNDEMSVKCSCGNEFKVGGISDNLHVEICAACHPFYTGKDRLIDTEGRVEKFRKKFKLN